MRKYVHAYFKITWSDVHSYIFVQCNNEAMAIYKKKQAINNCKKCNHRHLAGKQVFLAMKMSNNINLLN